MAIILWNKKYTETLSKTLERFRQDYPNHQDEKVTYAGRLDPMAEGLIILLTGDDVHKKNDYLNFDKVYEVEFFFGVRTDTYDILGFIDKTMKAFDVSDSELEKILCEKKGRSNQPYPPYSSKPVDGKPLFMWARENKLDHVEIPSREVIISNIQYLNNTKVKRENLEAKIIASISSVEGDFRQNEIIQKWQGHFDMQKSEKFITVYKIRVHASSGTYMRSLVVGIGERLGVPACTLKIKRISVGQLRLNI